MSRRAVDSCGEPMAALPRPIRAAAIHRTACVGARARPACGHADRLRPVGGASLGAAQAGMLQALYERGIRPDLFVGTSAGALNAAFAAFRAPHVETALELQDVWRRLRRSEGFPPNPLRAGLGFLGLRDHSVSSAALRQVVERHVLGERIEDADTPLHVVTADAVTGDEVLLSRGPLVDAVLASAA